MTVPVMLPFAVWADAGRHDSSSVTLTHSEAIADLIAFLLGIPRYDK